uniref:Uncharacterized protein n=1 Tax=Cacopsylla melanoneura TaxID=428564 RepID=A0A8D8RNF8_9HEMI
MLVEVPEADREVEDLEATNGEAHRDHGIHQDLKVDGEVKTATSLTHGTARVEAVVADGTHNNKVEVGVEAKVGGEAVREDGVAVTRAAAGVVKVAGVVVVQEAIVAMAVTRDQEVGEVVVHPAVAGTVVLPPVVMTTNRAMVVAR